jgi:hypothetical protein
MNAKEILQIASKLIGLYFSLKAVATLLEALFFTVGSEFGSDGRMIYFIQFVTLGLRLSIGLLLIFKSNWIASKLDPGFDGKFSTSLEKRDWIEIALILISLSILLQGIPEIFERIASFLYFERSDPMDGFQWEMPDHKAGMTFAFFRVLFALILISNIKYFAKLIDRQQ